MWSKVKGKLGTKGGIQQNADIPLKTNTPMKNIEGTQSFNVRVQCPSKKEGIKITFLPLSGNDYRLLIQEDLDQDGNYEYIYDTQTAGIRVSGVCSSGIVSCDPGGTWTNCEYYRWDGGASGYVTLVNTKDTSLLGGCFCSNSSCGVNSLVQDIVDYISGGISQAVMNARQDLGVSRANFDLTSMSADLYVQDRTQCAYAGTRIWGEQNPTDVYNTQTPPDGLSYIAGNPSVQTDPDSPYYLVNQASQVQVNGQNIGVPSRVSCDFRKDVFIGNTTEYFTGSYTQTICTDHFAYAALFDNGNGSFTIKLKGTSPSGVVGWNCGQGYWDINFNLNLQGRPVVQYKLIAEGTSGNGCTFQRNTAFNQGSWVLWATCPAADQQYPTGNFYYEIGVQSDTLSLSSTSNCSPSDVQGCTVKNEWICDNTGNNCIQTIKDGAKTGVSPMPFCYTTNSAIASYTICAYGDRIETRDSLSINNRTYTGQDMWFWIKREYECPSQTVSIDLSRTSAVIENTSYSPSSGQLSYTDFSCSGGTCTPVRADTANIGTPDSCPVAVCTVQTSQQDTSVFADQTNRSQTPGGTTTTPLEVRSCRKDSSGNWVCPAGNGETVVENCRCDQGLDSVGFSTSISTLQAVVDATKDIICSTVGP